MTNLPVDGFAGTVVDVPIFTAGMTHLLRGGHPWPSGTRALDQLVHIQSALELRTRAGQVSSPSQDLYFCVLVDGVPLIRAQRHEVPSAVRTILQVFGVQEERGASRAEAADATV